MSGEELRAHVAWLLWCMDQGYINKEDRDVGDGNWLLTPDSELHPDDRAGKPHLLAMADEILQEARREVGSMSSAARTRTPSPQPSGRTERPPAPPKGTLRTDSSLVAAVWMLVQEGEFHQWCPVSLHTTREGALAAIPTGAVLEPGDPDPDMCEPDEWAVPWRPQQRLSGARLRIQGWPLLV